MKRVVGLILCLMLVLFSGCNNYVKPVIQKEGVYGDYFAMSIDEYIEILMEYDEMNKHLKECREKHNCLAENDLIVTTIKADDGFYYWLILCESCNTYSLVYME